MIKSSVEKLAFDIGYDIGHSDNEVQAKLLNGFSKAINNSMDDNKIGTQICYIVDELTPESCKVINELHEFIELRNR